jgi:hypothetical protein
VDIVEDSARKLGQAFSRNVALIGFGPSLVRCSRASRFSGPQPFPSSLVITPNDVHAFVHRAHVLSLTRSARENERLQRGDDVTVVHTPMEWFPAAALQKATDKLGHVQARFYGDMAAEFVNCVLHACRKFDKTFGCRYLLCPGIPPMFVDVSGLIADPVLPREAHTHEGMPNECVGEYPVVGWGQPGGKLEVIWSDHENLVRVLHGETYATPMYLD